MLAFNFKLKHRLNWNLLILTYNLAIFRFLHFLVAFAVLLLRPMEDCGRFRQAALPITLPFENKGMSSNKVFSRQIVINQM